MGLAGAHGVSGGLDAVRQALGSLHAFGPVGRALRRAGGLRALEEVGRPADVLREAKERMFAA